MNPTLLQKLLASCMKMSLPLVSLENLIGEVHKENLIRKVKTEAKETHKIDPNGTCDLCGMIGNVREHYLRLEAELHGNLFSAPKTYFCVSCSAVVLKVRDLLNRRIQISKDFENIVMSVKAVLKFNIEGTHIHHEAEDLKFVLLDEPEEILQGRAIPLANTTTCSNLNKTDELQVTITRTAKALLSNSKHDHETTKNEHRKRHQKGPLCLTCYFCQKQLTTEFSLNEHLRNFHLNELPESCFVHKCDFRTAVKELWRKHLVTQHPKEWKTYLDQNSKQEYKCSLCPKVFKSPTYYHKHTMTHNKPRPVYPCDMCPKTFLKNRYLREHAILKHGKPGEKFTCRVENCGASFVNTSSLEKHIQRKHNPDPLSCKDCGAVLKNLQSLKQHREHNKQCADLTGRDIVLFNCPHCTHYSSFKGDIKNHIKSVHNSNIKQFQYKWKNKESGFKCYFCEFRVKPGRLKEFFQHINGRHLREFPLACKGQGCRYRAASERARDKHMQTKHAEEWKTFNKKRKIKKAQKLLRKKEELEVAKSSRMIRKKEIVPCPYPGCLKSFPFSTMKCHISRAHSLKTRYTCNQCGAPFGFLKHRKDHMVQIHGGIPCDICNIVFDTHQSFSTHRKNVHGIHSERKRRNHENFKHTCYFCKTRFATRPILEKHMMKMHTNERIFACRVKYCGYHSTKKRLDTHMRSEHKRLY